MKKADRWGKTTAFKTDYYTVVILLSVVAMLVLRIPLGYMIGDKANAYFSIANELYYVLAGTFSYGLTEAVAALIRYRVKREQYKSAQLVLRGALLLGAALGICFILLFGLGGNMLASNVFNLPLSGLAIRLMAPAIFFTIETGVFRGYFQGNGSKMPTIHSRIISAVFYIAGGVIGTMLMKSYGQKISALLQNEDYTSAYGAMGATIALLTASFFSFLHMLILFFIFEHNKKKLQGREIARKQDNSLHIYQMLVGAGMSFAFSWLAYNCIPLVQMQLLFHLYKDGSILTAQWGAYYGKYMVLIGTVSLITYLFFIAPIRRIFVLHERGDFRVVRERLSLLIHQCAAITIPTAVFLAVFSENILDLIWKGDNKQTAGWVQLGAVLVVLFSFATMFMELLQKCKRQKLVLLLGGVSLLANILFSAILLMNTKLSIITLTIGNIVYYLLLTVCGFCFVSRILQYKQEWMRSFAFTLIAGAVSGVIAMLLNKVFVPMIGSAISFFICLPVAVIVYIILLSVMRGFTEEELHNMAGGRVILWISDLFHLE